MIDAHYELAGRPGHLRAELLFRMDAIDGGGFATDDEFYAWNRESFRALDVKMADKFWTSLPADHPRLAEVVERLETLFDAGRVRPGSGTFGTWIEDDAARPVDWFEVHLKTSLDLDRLDPPTAKICNLPPGVHLAAMGGVFASEEVKKVFESASVTGAEFLWVRDKGRFAAPPWYEIMPTDCLGRGIDHPWFDWAAYRAAMLAEGMAPNIDDWHRHAARQIPNRYFVDDWATGDPTLDALLRLFPVGTGLDRLEITSFARVLRAFVPETDVAFISGSPHPDAHDQADDERQLCVRRWVRDLLIDEALAREEDFHGVALLDAPPVGAMVLDDPGNPSPPKMSPTSLAAFREKEAKAWAAHVAKPKPPRAPDLKRSLRLLRSARERDDRGFAKGATAKKLSSLDTALGRPVADAWRAVLKVSDGFETRGDQDFTLLGSADLPGFHEETAAWIADLSLAAPAAWLAIGYSDTGDFVVLDTESGDEPQMLLVGHETQEVDRRWESVAAFLEEVVR